MALLGFVVVVIDLEAEPDFFQSHVGLILPSFTSLLGRFIFELAVVHEFDNRWLGLRRNLYKVQIGRASKVECLSDGDNSNLFSVWSDESDLWNSNAIVNTRLADVLLLLKMIVHEWGTKKGPFAQREPT